MVKTVNKISKEKPTKSGKLKEHPRSYRLDPELKEILYDTLYRINKLTPKKISEARLIKALILLSRDLDDEKIIKALKEVW